MTKAGFENWLLELVEAGGVPDGLVMDELEKQDSDNLRGLLSIMGSGLLTKLNARTSNVRRKVRFLVVGICNDEEKLKNFDRGALWSRFAHKLPCVRPSKELCLLILREMVGKIPGGRSDWADYALAFGWNVLGERDIREIKRHLDGGDHLRDGSWQLDQLAIRAAKQREDQELLRPQD